MKWWLFTVFTKALECYSWQSVARSIKSIGLTFTQYLQKMWRTKRIEHHCYHGILWTTWMANKLSPWISQSAMATFLKVSQPVNQYNATVFAGKYSIHRINGLVVMFRQDLDLIADTQTGIKGKIGIY